MSSNDNIVLELKHAQQQLLAYMQTHWRLILFEGIFFILLGFCAFIIPRFFSVFIAIYLGWIVVVAGITQVCRVSFLPKAPGYGLWLGLGILQVIVGYLLIADPIAGVLSLTLIMALFFAVEGIIKIYMSWTMRPLPDWGYLLLSGITAVILALVMLVFWSDIPVPLLGLFLGINMMMLGVAMVKIGLQHDGQTDKV